jgi:hypothetical protein
VTNVKIMMKSISSGDNAGMRMMKEKKTQEQIITPGNPT